MNIVEITNTVNITLVSIMYLSLFATLAEVVAGERLLNLVAKTPKESLN